MEKSSNKSRHNVKLVGRTARERLRDVSRRPPAIDAQDVVAAFNGRPLSMTVGSTRAPDMLLAVRNALMDRLRSTGGRPGLAGEGARQRVQVSAQDWQRIADIADHVEVGRHKPSPAQVASVLIHLALERIPAKEVDRLVQAEQQE
jgi:hypothetical protein